MSNVTSWTEREINNLVQAWREVEAKYPLLRCERGTSTLHTKMYALFSRRSTFPRSSLAVSHAKNHIRGFVLFVVKYDKERQKDGGQFWFDLSAEERNRHRDLVPRRSRELTTALSKEAFDILLKMVRVQRWLGGSTDEIFKAEEDGAQELREDTSFLAPGPRASHQQPTTKNLGKRKARSLRDSHTELDSMNFTQEDEELEQKRHVPVQERSDTSTCSLYSDSCDDSSPDSISPQPDLSRTAKFQEEKKNSGGNQEVRSSLKHRDCNILLERMMELQNKKMRRAVVKLRAEIEGEIQRCSEMLLSIITNQFRDPGSSSDVAFVTKVLNMQKQQVYDRFDQFEEKRVRDEAANRALLGQRYKAQN